LHAALDAIGGQVRRPAPEHDLRDGRVADVHEGVDRARPDRVAVDVVQALGEVDMAPALLDVPEQLVQPDLLVMRHRGLHVPVAERTSVGRLDPDRVALVLDEDLAGRDGVDGGAVRRRDVDAEVEGVALILDAGIVEEAPHRMLAIERLDRPRIGSRHGQASVKR
jgi:hypothetical protein